MIRVARSDNFDINREGDELLVTDAGGDWARFQVFPRLDSQSWGSAVIGLFGSGNPDPSDQASLYELSVAARLDGDFGISPLINTKLIPRLAVRVITPQGSAAVQCGAFLIYETGGPVDVVDVALPEEIR